MINIKIVKVGKDYCCFHAQREGGDGWIVFTEGDRLDLFAGENGMNEGTYIHCRGTYALSRETSTGGKYVKVGNLVFLQEEVPQFYA